LTRQWRCTWDLALLAMISLIAYSYYFPAEGGHFHEHRQLGFYSLCAGVLLVFCLLQVQVGTLLRSPYMLNLAVAFIALDTLAAYIGLFGSMARTGLVFLFGGVFLIVFGIYLEKKRRALMKQIKATAA